MKLISNQISKNSLLCLATLLFSPCMLIAHPGDGEIHTLSDGIQHFFSGWDHILLSALAGILITSKHKFCTFKSIVAVIAIPFVLTVAHQSLLLSVHAQLIALTGMVGASVVLITLGCLAPMLIANVNANLATQWRRIGIGFALLALALIKM